MDQPHNGDDNTNNGNPMPDQPTDQATPITVNVTTSDESPSKDEAPSEVDAVMDGVPSSVEATETSAPESVSVPVVSVEQSADTSETSSSASTETTPTQISVESAEAEVADASPSSTEDELAGIASEIESIAATGASVDEPAGSAEPEHSAFGTDPMQQIMSEASDEEKAEMTSSGSGEETTSEVGDGETSDETNVEVTDTPAYEEKPAETVEASSESVAVEPSTNETTSDSQESNQNIAVESEPMGEQTSESSESTQEPNQNALPPLDPSVINDVVAPTAVAAAAASGSLGENAITGTPETSTVESAQGAQLANQKEQAMHKPKSGKGKLIAVVLVVTMLFAGGAVAAYMMSNKDTDTKQSTTTQSTANTASTTEEDTTATTPTATPAPGEKVEAKVLDDYKAACATGGLVTNATAYKGAAPHPVVLFEKGSDDKYALSLTSFKDKTWSADTTKVTSGQLVTCIARKTASEVKLKSCPITDATTKVTTNVDFYSTKYTVDVYEALTGKKVTSFENASVSTTCPTTATYNKGDPKIFANFDLIGLETSLKDYVTKTL